MAQTMQPTRTGKWIHDPAPSPLAHDLYAAIADRCSRLPGARLVGGQEGLRWKTLSGRQMADRVEALARDLHARGVTEGGRVVLWVPNGWRTPALFAAIWRLGAIAVPFDREMNVEAARAILQRVRPALVITGYSQRPPWTAASATEEWWEPGSGSGSAPQAEPDGERAAVIYFTSGTTGAPKGCTLTHHNLLSQATIMPQMVPLRPGDVLGSILPLSHIFELSCGMIYPILQGASIAYIPSRKGPDIMRVLKEQHVTHMVVVPQVLGLMGGAAEDRLRRLLGDRLYKGMLRLADHLPMGWRRLLFWPVLHRLGGRLRVVASGGAALNPDVQRLWERMGIRTLQGYGASECSPIIACGRADGSAPYGTVGTPVPGTEIRVDQSGQLLVRGPNVMQGYWEDPERTAQVMTADGFYATGDIVERDARGNITILGRAQELLVLPSGMKVWPDDVEAQLRKVDAVKDAVVILVPGASGGATLHAYLLPRGARDPEAIPGIVAAANGHLAGHQRVATASWWPEDDFPRTSTLKIKRRLIPLPDRLPAREHSTQQLDVTQAADDPVAASLRAVVAGAAVGDSQTLAELGLDSLGLVGLAVEIESRTGLTIPDGTLDTSMSLPALRNAISAIATGSGPSVPGDTSTDDRMKRAEEAHTWLPPLWLYTKARILRRLRMPIDVLHRRAVPRVVVLGAEYLEILREGAILAGTHRSFADVSTIHRALAETLSPDVADRLTIAASSAIVGRAGWLGRLVTVSFGLFPLRQYGGQEESLRRLAQIADAGNSILLFPQGHHTDPDDERRSLPSADFKPGIGRLASDLGLPVLPFGLAGTDQVVAPRPPETFTGLVIAGIPVRYHRRPVAVAFGVPMRPEASERASAFASRLQAVCFSLSRQAEAALAIAARPDAQSGSPGE
jgi:long-chain acyl-CoA synthetase